MTQVLTEAERKMMLWSMVAALAMLVLITAWLSIVRVNKPINTDVFGLAIEGYDPVAYFSEGRARRGSSQFEVNWKEAHWRFATAEHRDLFKADPQRYAPQFGGFCAAYLAQGGVTRVDPEAWIIIDGKLYLGRTKEDLDNLLSEDTAAKLEAAAKEWASRQPRR